MKLVIVWINEFLLNKASHDLNYMTTWVDANCQLEASSTTKMMIITWICWPDSQKEHDTVPTNILFTDYLSLNISSLEQT